MSTTIPFQWTLEGKAPVSELDGGDLLIEGFAVRTDEIDREGESWAASWDETSALWRGVRKFLEGNAPLCFHHDFKTVLGKVTEATPVSGKGLKVRAVVDYQPPGSPWRHLYDAIKRGRLANLSFGGIFHREMTAKGPVIGAADFLELSVCSSSVGRGTSFEVVRGKALTSPPGRGIGGAPDLSDIRRELAELEQEADRLRTEAQKAPIFGHGRGRAAAEAYVAPADRRYARLEIDPETRQKQRLRNLQDAQREESQRRDVVTEQTVEVRLSDLYGGGHRRDRHGEIVPGEAFDPSPVETPKTIPGSALQRLFGIVPPAPRELTAEEQFTAAERVAERASARKDEDRRWTEGIRDRFAALSEAKEDR